MSPPITTSAWYKQPWLWFILTPLIVVFIVGTSFAYLSVITFDGMVKGDYAKTAKSINMDTSRLRAASDTGLTGTLHFDSVTGDLRLTLAAQQPLDMANLTLLVIHPTVEDLDQDLILARRPDGKYYGALTKNITGKRYLHLMDPEKTWLITKTLYSPWPNAVNFVPNLGIPDLDGK